MQHDLFCLPSDHSNLSIEAKRKAPSEPSKEKEEVKKVRFYDTFELPRDQSYVSLINDSSICYLNVIVYNAFYLEPFRKYVMNDMVVGGSRLLKLLKELFTKLSTQRYECDAKKLVHYLSDHSEGAMHVGGDTNHVQATFFKDLMGLDKHFDKLLPAYVNVDLNAFVSSRFYSNVYRPGEKNGTNLEQFENFFAWSMIRNGKGEEYLQLRQKYQQYDMLYFAIHRLNTTKEDAKHYLDAILPHPFTFPLTLLYFDEFYELYSVYVRDFRWKETGHIFVLIRGQWKKYQDPSWMLFSDTEVGEITQEKMEEMAFGGTHLGANNLKFAYGLTYVKQYLYQDEFHWDLNVPSFHK